MSLLFFFFFALSFSESLFSVCFRAARSCEAGERQHPGCRWVRGRRHCSTLPASFFLTSSVFLLASLFLLSFLLSLVWTWTQQIVVTELNPRVVFQFRFFFVRFQNVFFPVLQNINTPWGNMVFRAGVGSQYPPRDYKVHYIWNI